MAMGWGRVAVVGVMLSLQLAIVPMGLAGASTPSSAGTQVAATFSGAEGEYTPLTPKRLLDTRAGVGGWLGKVGAGQSVPLQIEGAQSNYVPASDVAAVVLNVTVTQPVLTGRGFVTVYPDDPGPPPTASNLNFVNGETRANLVTVKLGTNGRVRLLNGHGSAHLIADVMGYYAEAAGTPGSRFHGLSPARILDTRNSVSNVSPSITPLHVTGANGVPSGATAVVLNVTVTQATVSGFVTVYPSGGTTPPTASNLNFAAGQTVANLVIVKVGPPVPPFSHQVRILFDTTGHLGRGHLIVDVMGYYEAGFGDTGRFVPVPPVRFLDTRASPPALGPNEDGFLYVLDNGGVPASGVAAILMNVTATSPTTGGYLTVYPADEVVPPTSSLNFKAGQTVPNLVMVSVSTNFVPEGEVVGEAGWVGIHNGPGSTQVIADIGGYFVS